MLIGFLPIRTERLPAPLLNLSYALHGLFLIKEKILIVLTKEAGKPALNKAYLLPSTTSSFTPHTSSLVLGIGSKYLREEECSPKRTRESPIATLRPSHLAVLPSTNRGLYSTESFGLGKKINRRAFKALP